MSAPAEKTSAAPAKKETPARLQDQPLQEQEGSAVVSTLLAEFGHPDEEGDPHGRSFLGMGVLQTQQDVATASKLRRRFGNRHLARMAKLRRLNSTHSIQRDDEGAASAELLRKVAYAQSVLRQAPPLPEGTADRIGEIIGAAPIYAMIKEKKKRDGSQTS